LNKKGQFIGPRHQDGPAGTDFFRPTFKEVKGDIVLGSVSSNDKEPIMGVFNGREIAVNINGRVLNIEDLKREILDSDFIPTGYSHAQIIGNLIGKKKDIIEGIKHAWEKTEGAQNILIVFDGSVIAARHPDAVLPLVIGIDEKGDRAVSSSDFVLRKLNFAKQIPLKGGDIYRLNREKIEHLQKGQDGKRKCAFLYTYTGHLDDEMDGLYAAELRERLGRSLFKNDVYVKELLKSGKIKEEDIVVSPILMSGLGAAVGYHKQALDEGYKLSFAPVFIPSQRYKRSFVPETDEERKIVATFKLDEIRYYIKDKFIILVDDSLVRGTQTEARVNMLRKYSAKGMVFRSSHPKIFEPCSYRLSTQKKEELATHKYDTDEATASAIGVDHVAFNSYEDYVNAFADLKDSLCVDCARPRN
jgi:amidophosphoribosyltransferase